MIVRDVANSSTSLRPIFFKTRGACRNVLYVILLPAFFTLVGCRQSDSPVPPAANEPNESTQAEPNESKVAPATTDQRDVSSETITTQTSLFDGKTPGKWKGTDFGGTGGGGGEQR